MISGSSYRYRITRRKASSQALKLMARNKPSSLLGSQGREKLVVDLPEASVRHCENHVIPSRPLFQETDDLVRIGNEGGARPFRPHVPNELFFRKLVRRRESLRVKHLSNNDLVRFSERFR